MKVIEFYRRCLLISFSILIIGASFKIQHWPGANMLLLSGYLISLIYVIMALVEVFKADEKSVFEKLLWLFGFLTFSWGAGMLYYFKEMKPRYLQSRAVDKFFKSMNSDMG